jgi:ABC-type amino acid transport system permease subunit
MRKVELFSFPISPSYTAFLLPQTQNGVLLNLSVIGDATNEFISLKKGSALGVGIEVEETINTECDDIEETTADRNAFRYWCSITSIHMVCL